jgi:hypothetical protein
MLKGLPIGGYCKVPTFSSNSTHLILSQNADFHEKFSCAQKITLEEASEKRNAGSFVRAPLLVRRRVRIVAEKTDGVKLRDDG